MNQYEEIYRNVTRMVPGIAEAQPGDHFKLTARGFMDLHVDVLHRGVGAKTGDPQVRISMAHNYIQEGDVMADPDMEVRLYPTRGVAEALTFQMANPPIYQEVYPEPGYVNPRLKKQLNAFLRQWVRNLKEQGHALAPKEESTAA